MSIVFLSRLIPESIKTEISETSKRGMPEAAIALQNKILKGIAALSNEEIIMVNVVPISSYPKNSSIRIIPSLSESYGGFGTIHNAGFLNYMGVRNKSIEKGICNSVDEIDNVSRVIIYSTAPYFLDAARYIKRKHKDCHIILIIPDVPEYSNLKASLSIKEKIYSLMSSRKFEKAKGFIDSLVLLTKQTAEYLNWSKPYTVVEGISDSSNIVSTASKDEKKSIVYTGTTHIRFGLPLLVEAFERIPDNDIELIICGYGDYDEQIKKIAQNDSRIKFLGKVSHEKALNIQMNATVLVNPRMNDGEYTKFSFPSKTMEYLTTGNPVIACKLHGIPDEYDPFIIYVEDESVDGLEKKLLDVLSWTDEDRRSFGKNARNFVINTKNEMSQAKKILDLFQL